MEMLGDVQRVAVWHITVTRPEGYADVSCLKFRIAMTLDAQAGEREQIYVVGIDAACKCLRDWCYRAVVP